MTPQPRAAELETRVCDDCGRRRIAALEMTKDDLCGAHLGVRGTLDCNLTTITKLRDELAAIAARAKREIVAELVAHAERHARIGHDNGMSCALAIVDMQEKCAATEPTGGEG